MRIVGATVSERCLPNANETRYISSLDLKDGYWQIPLEENSRQSRRSHYQEKGLFQLRVMPLSIHSATFQQVLDQVITSRIRIPG